MDTSIVNNPLAKHFRQPAVFLKLPSGGKFYPTGTLELGATGELPIYPMTVKDELMLKTPDALMNGSSMANMIASCCPNIKDPWAIPVTDLDPILIAIRLASYGNAMDMTSQCGNCEAENEHTIDLRAVLDSVKPTKSFDQKVLLDKLVFELQPQNYKELNQINMITFEQQKLISVINDSELADNDKRQQFQESFRKLTDLNLGTLVACIKAITMDDGTEVVEKDLIKDYLEHCDRKTFELVRDTILKVTKENGLAPVELICNECKTEYKATLEFNQSNFFV